MEVAGLGWASLGPDATHSSDRQGSRLLLGTAKKARPNIHVAVEPWHARVSLRGQNKVGDCRIRKETGLFAVVIGWRKCPWSRHEYDLALPPNRPWSSSWSQDQQAQGRIVNKFCVLVPLRHNSILV